MNFLFADSISPFLCFILIIYIISFCVFAEEIEEEEEEREVGDGDAVDVNERDNDDDEEEDGKWFLFILFSVIFLMFSCFFLRVRADVRFPWFLGFD